MPFKIDTYAVLGNPIAHSLSPFIHRAFAQQTGARLDYQALEVPLDGLPLAIARFQQEGGKGLNITLPFKQQAFTLMTACSERARLAQAVNTVIIQADGQLIGDNTDGVGLIRDITHQQGETLQGQRILVLGAGGAVRGLLGPLLAEQPTTVVIANRTATTAQQLAQSFSRFGAVRGCGLETLAVEQPFDLIINGTSVSLHGQMLPLPAGLLAPQGWCYDLVYAVQPTFFLQWAKNQGARKSIDGLGMLIEQAAEAFHLWRGIRPQTLPVLKQVRAYLQH